MKNLLVIANAGESAAQNIHRAATDSQPLPKGVSQLAPNSWLIDAHTSLQFFARLVRDAEERKIQLAVFHIEDEAILLPPRQ